ncbi:Biopolymer transport protein exbD2 [Alteripontixanthobacter maritimus]|uniref:Biopolymer transport protein exbD2 n=1 Tax=Alteripontixanthobacter maritimus TaxID=2161824 RepID=A0A369Q859_9SPHN|nr:biopolymer transporter ExbD [Alteripontixanthobacter maritimus]RDC60652.1 Biopolymer transport protein exbD2 [Alteripontixanthobacter maritimus]
MAMGVAKVGGRARKSRRTPMAEINVTPLVDVMLVLLIIFMVTAPLLTAGVPVDLPDSRANPLDQTPDQVTISIDDGGFIFLDDDAVPVGGLPAALDSVRAANSGGELPMVTLRADRGLDYGRVMAVMGELNRSGFTAISLVTNGSGDAP